MTDYSLPTFGTLDRERLCLPPEDLPTVRSCLRCGVAFPSTWRGNRLCPTCRRRATDDGGGPDLPIHRPAGC